MPGETPPRLTLVVLLTIDPDRREDFLRFEASAAAIMKRYGGEIERRVSFSAPEPPRPDELHVVTFPDRDSFDRYRHDPDLEPLAALRTAAIRETVVWDGVDLQPFAS
jgi:uncharacterized protein (DUF1330 family)